VPEAARQRAAAAAAGVRPGEAELRLDAELTARLLQQFIREEVTKVGLERAVVGLSGGIDSALSAALAAHALGPRNVTALTMPYRSSSPDSLRHAAAVAEQFNLEVRTIEITPMVDPYFRLYEPEADAVRRGNKMARERMSILYDHSAKLRALVLGTSNKTELLLGYGTLHGDMASAVNPLGDLYKTQVRQLARHLAIPSEIIDKKPSADLWVGQSDEDEMGFTYEEVDRLLYFLVDRRFRRDECVALGFVPVFVDAVHAKVQGSQFKRRLPVIAKVSHRTIDRDFRYARDWGR
jgi:NAD+ synthase